MTDDRAKDQCTITCTSNSAYAKEGCVSIAKNSHLWTEHSGDDRISLSLKDKPQKIVQLQPMIREHGAGNEVFVVPKTLGLKDGDKNKPGWLSTSTACAARRGWLIHSGEGRLTLFGLALALIAVVLNVSLLLGEVWPLIVVGSGGIAISKVAAAVLGFTGVLLVFLISLNKH